MMKTVSQPMEHLGSRKLQMWSRPSPSLPGALLTCSPCAITKPQEAEIPADGPRLLIAQLSSEIRGAWVHVFVMQREVVQQCKRDCNNVGCVLQGSHDIDGGRELQAGRTQCACGL